MHSSLSHQRNRFFGLKMNLRTQALSASSSPDFSRFCQREWSSNMREGKQWLPSLRESRVTLRDRRRRSSNRFSRVFKGFSLSFSDIVAIACSIAVSELLSECARYRERLGPRTGQCEVPTKFGFRFGVVFVREQFSSSSSNALFIESAPSSRVFAHFCKSAQTLSSVLAISIVPFLFRSLSSSSSSLPTFFSYQASIQSQACLHPDSQL